MCWCWWQWWWWWWWGGLVMAAVMVTGMTMKKQIFNTSTTKGLTRTRVATAVVRSSSTSSGANDYKRGMKRTK